MKGSPKIGTPGEQQFVVEPKHAIDFADAHMPAVLSTPWLIWFLGACRASGRFAFARGGRKHGRHARRSSPPGGNAGGRYGYMFGPRCPG